MTDVVLVRVAGRQRGTGGVYHLPASDDAIRPKCDGAHTAETAYRRRDPNDVPDSYRLCKHCDPDHKVDRSGGNPSTSPGLILEAMDPNDLPVGGTDG